ncbi:MAG TPA: alpha-glucan family phosphorylase [Planctomycetota bacterium]|nr:alpha-glucan family phosphorylase [Planctomycetota bacterium]
MKHLIRTLPPEHLEVPDALAPLIDLAYNFWWTWHRDARTLFERIDPDLWSRYRNPVRLLIQVRRARLAELTQDAAFLAELRRLADRLHAEIGGERSPEAPVAYVSAEYALTEALPIYSGGLGVLSGDHLKEASDMGLPLVGVGLFYRRGYFHQLVDADGAQQHDYPELDAMRLPLLRVAGRDGSTLRVPVEVGERNVSLRVWCAFVGHVPLLLLDSFTTHNPPEDRFITSQLYVRGRDMRLEQEIVLGRGAVAVLAALGIRPRVWHMNEGHSAFLALENARRSGAGSLQPAVEAARPLHVFTTHTPVPAGNEVFADDKVRPYLLSTARDLGTGVDELLELGRAPSNGFPPGFNLTALALRLSRTSNAVSRLHGQVSRDMWPEHEIGAITNGVHVPTWMGREMARVLQAIDAEDPFELARRAAALSDGVLWAAHVAQKHRLMRFVRVRAMRQAARHGHAPADLRRVENLLNPAALTLGWARRFAPYKRPDLLFHDPGRLGRLLGHAERPVQLVIAGKAHPADRAGQDMIRRIWELASSPELRGRVVFVENYDAAVARLLVRGVDVWLNTPTWPMEASGTSGMKAACNGVINVSVPDGWWAEGYAPGVGYALGEARPPDGDRDAGLLYEMLEGQIVPLYYERDTEGLPRGWIEMMRASLAAFLGRFSTRRMLREYAGQVYLLPGYEPAPSQAETVVS